MYSPDKKRIWKKRCDGGEAGDAAREAAAASIAAECGISAACARLVYDRGYRTPDDARDFINKKYDGGHDPFLLTDMDRACDRIERAIDSGAETVAVWGDYDVDGVTSASLLYLYFTKRGLHAGYYIPTRSEGYGMNVEEIDRLRGYGVTLIVTVDTGITAVGEVDYANSVGIDVVVTDHHECHEELPRAAAVVNPHRPGDAYPMKELAGVGVALKLVSALEIRRAGREGESVDAALAQVMRDYADLAAIGTIADVMPLTGENRAIVSYGLQLITYAPRTGVAALIGAIGRTLKGVPGASYVSFNIAPRINAAGRMDNASLAVELLLSDDPEDAAARAAELSGTNSARQQEENRIATEAIGMVEDNPDFADDRVILLGSDDWNQGVIGIVASRITEKFDRPAILVSFSGETDDSGPSPSDVGKGSGRSVPGFNLFDALSACSDCLVRFGGHEQAAGLSVRRDMMETLRARLNEYAAEHSDGIGVQVIEYDSEPDPAEIDAKLADEISGVLEPCGAGNPSPLFLMSDVCVKSAYPVASGKHTKLSVEAGGLLFDAMIYSTPISAVPYGEGDAVDLLFTAEKNEYRGRVGISLIVKDIRTSTRAYNERLREIAKLRSMKKGEPTPDAEADIPGREDFVVLYGLLERIVDGGRTSFSDLEIMRALALCAPGIGYVKYKIMLGVFGQTGVFEIEENTVTDAEGSSEWKMPCDVVTVRRPECRRKADLDASPLMKNVRASAGKL